MCVCQVKRKNATGLALATSTFGGPCWSLKSYVAARFSKLVRFSLSRFRFHLTPTPTGRSSRVGVVRQGIEPTRQEGQGEAASCGKGMEEPLGREAKNGHQEEEGGGGGRGGVHCDCGELVSTIHGGGFMRSRSGTPKAGAASAAATPAATVLAFDTKGDTAAGAKDPVKVSQRQSNSRTHSRLSCWHNLSSVRPPTGVPASEASRARRRGQHSSSRYDIHSFLSQPNGRDARADGRHSLHVLQGLRPGLPAGRRLPRDSAAIGPRLHSRQECPSLHLRDYGIRQDAHDAGQPGTTRHAAPNSLLDLRQHPPVDGAPLHL